MKLLANENFPLKSTQLLRQEGFDIKAIGSDNPGIADRDVIQIAKQEERTIITFDKDYGELIFKYGYRPKAGVIFLRIVDFTPEYPAKHLLKIFQSQELDFKGKLSVIDSSKVRQRKY